MKKMLGLMIVLFSICFVMPAKAQSAAGAVIKTTTKEARAKIKEVTQAKAAAKKNTAAKTTATTRKWGAATANATSDKGGNKGQVIIPVHPVPVVDAGKKYVPVDTSQFHPW